MIALTYLIIGAITALAISPWYKDDARTYVQVAPLVALFWPLILLILLVAICYSVFENLLGRNRSV